MREALAARSGRDFVTTGASPFAGGGRRLGSVLIGLVRLVIRYPSVVMAGAILIVAGAAVSLNALAWQTTRHPAPLFGTRGAPPERRPAPVPVPVPVPAPLPPLPPLRPAAIIPEPGVPAPARSQPVAAPAPKPAPPRDPIGDMIRNAETTASASAKSDASKIAAAQRALTKLSYGALKPDGVVGPETRQAIERFEKDRRLPVTGELHPRTARELGSQAGIPIE